MEIDLNKTKSAWTRYVKKQVPPPVTIDGVRAEIVESWQRSLSALPFRTEIPCQLDPLQLEQVKEKKRQLLRTARPYLEDLSHRLQGLNCQFLLTDQNGCLLHCIFDSQRFRELASHTGVVEGRILTEAASGTNGVSFCLARKEMVEVVGSEHFLPEFHVFFCAAAPILDPSGRLTGCLSIMTTLENRHPFMTAMLAAAVNGIERELYLSRNNRFLTTMLDSFSSGVLLLDGNRQILRSNRLAAALLGQTELEGRSIYRLIRQDSLPDYLQNLEKPVKQAECTLVLADGSPLEVSVTLRVPEPDQEGTLLILERQDDLHRLTNQLSGNYASLTFRSLVTTSPLMDMVKAIGNLAAQSKAPALISGEAGTGRSSLAQAIHNTGDRQDQPFLLLNCQTLTTEKLRRELLGCESDPDHPGMPGKLELARGGTLFLEEISALSLDLQQELLNALRTGQLLRIGGSIPKSLDVRVIASTQVDLLAAVQNGAFLADLYYLFHTLSIVLPPLRQRKEDILPLAERSLSGYARTFCKNLKGFSEKCQQALLHYDWPKNIPELEKVVERAAGRAEGEYIEFRDLPDEVARTYLEQNDREENTAIDSDAPPSVLSPDALEYSRILQVLRREHGHMRAAAQSLGIPLSSLYRKVNKYGIDLREFRSWK